MGTAIFRVQVNKPNEGWRNETSVYFFRSELLEDIVQELHYCKGYDYKDIRIVPDVIV